MRVYKQHKEFKMTHTIELQLLNLDGTKESMILYGIRSTQAGEEISNHLKEYGYKSGTLYKIIRIHS
jgi:hypothetical protein